MTANVATASGGVCRATAGTAAAPIVDAGTAATDACVAARVCIWFLIYRGDADTVLRRHLRPTDHEMRERNRENWFSSTFSLSAETKTNWKCSYPMV